MKAFIGDSHPKLPAYIKKTMAGSYVIAAPNIPLPINSDIGKLKGTCFTTDGRTFNSDPLNSARVTVELLITITNKRQMTIGKWENRDIIRIGASQNVDCLTGALLQPIQTADSSSVDVGSIRSHNFLNTFNIRASSPNPFYKLAGLSIAPDIDFEIVFEHDILAERIDIKGSCGYFPWFEAYYQIIPAAPHSIYKISPFDTSTADSLFDFGLGINTRNISAAISLR